MRPQSSVSRPVETTRAAGSRTRHPTTSPTAVERDDRVPWLPNVPILVVEDDPPHARLLSVLLTNEGCDVRIARTAEEALQLLRAFPARLIVLDLVLPRMSGLLFVRHLKSAASTRDIVIVAISAVNGSEVERLAKEAGCAAYIRKPIDMITFIRTLASCLSRKDVMLNHLAGSQTSLQKAV
jgi:CheY-like chemotaxis protein